LSFLLHGCKQDSPNIDKSFILIQKFNYNINDARKYADITIYFGYIYERYIERDREKVKEQSLKTKLIEIDYRGK